MTALVILERVRAGGLLAPGRPVLVLLSGGRDSVCLLDLAVRITGPDAVRALHVNYRLREESDDDERHSVELCEKLGVPIEVERPSRRPARGNLQGWAREVRYEAAAELAGPAGADVAAGHTATDQVEGVLYRLASAPGRRALLGMRERNGIVVRPLLGLTRAQTGAYCTERGLGWREDTTNAGGSYTRGRVRRDLVPTLLAIHPGAEANVLALVEILRAEAAVLDSLVDDVLQGRREIELARLRELPAALRRLVVQRLADLASDRPVPGIAKRADELAALRERGSASLDLGFGVRAMAEYGVLRFELVTEPALAPADVRLAVPGSVGFGAYEVRCELGAPERRAGCVDRAALAPELVVRTWRRGDRMAPLGLQGTKSLQDLFTARRVARARRATVPVVESGGEIVWVAGVATSERFKVRDATREAAYLTAVESRPVST